MAIHGRKSWGWSRELATSQALCHQSDSCDIFTSESFDFFNLIQFLQIEILIEENVDLLEKMLGVLKYLFN